MLGTGVNQDVSTGESVTSSRTVSTFDRVVLWRVVIGIMNLSNPIDALRWVSHSYHLIYAHESRRSTMIFSSPCLNWFSVSADSILCWEYMFFYLDMSRSSVIFGKCFFYSLPVGKYSGCSKLCHPVWWVRLLSLRFSWRRKAYSKMRLF